MGRGPTCDLSSETNSQAYVCFPVLLKHTPQTGSCTDLGATNLNPGVGRVMFPPKSLWEGGSFQNFFCFWYLLAELHHCNPCHHLPMLSSPRLSSCGVLHVPCLVRTAVREDEGLRSSTMTSSLFLVVLVFELRAWACSAGLSLKSRPPALFFLEFFFR
jgi:hypothetical protein